MAGIIVPVPIVRDEHIVTQLRSERAEGADDETVALVAHEWVAMMLGDPRDLGDADAQAFWELASDLSARITRAEHVA